METIRIATLNPLDLGLVRPEPEGDGRAADRARLLADLHFTATIRLLARIRADVLALQEVFSNEALDEVLAGTPYEHYQRTPLDPDPEVERHQVILSRFPLKEFHLHRQVSRLQWIARGDGAPVDVRWNRPIVEVSIDLPGVGWTRFLSVHLKSKRPSDAPGLGSGPDGWPSLATHAEGLALSSLKRVGQALELRRLVDRIFSRYAEARIVVLGDFNDTTDSVPFTIIRGSYVEARNMALWDQELYPVELSLPAEKQFTLLHDGKPQMIDHILISRALLASFRSATILNETLRDHWATPRSLEFLPESDHAPVVAEFWCG
jgi:endonuclease/exonuclease/phosphatase family metal-dependent hydrolase